MRFMKSLLFLSAGTLLLLGCQDPSLPSAVLSSTVRSANIVLINAAPDAPSPQPFLINNAQAASVGFPGGSVPTAINAGIEQFRIKNATYGVVTPDTVSQKADLVTQTSASAIQGSGNYTMILTDTVNRPFGKGTGYNSNKGGLTFTMLAETLTAPTSGNGGIRFFNLAPGAASVYLTHDGGSTFSGLTSSFAYKKTTTTFTSIPAGSYTLEVRTGSASGTLIASIPSTAIASGKLYTVFLSGKVVKIGTSSVVKVPYSLSVVGHN